MATSLPLRANLEWLKKLSKERLVELRGLNPHAKLSEAQRDLAQARQNELASVLAYDLSLVDLEALQQAGPAGQP